MALGSQGTHSRKNHFIRNRRIVPAQTVEGHAEYILDEQYFQDLVILTLKGCDT